VRERRETEELPEQATDKVRAIVAGYGLTGSALDGAVAAVTAQLAPWPRFMMREELGLEESDPRWALASGLTIATAYVAGGLLPLLPYVFALGVNRALPISAVVTLVAPAVFGWVKAGFTGLSPVRGAVQMVLLGGIAAGIAYALARMISDAAGI